MRIITKMALIASFTTFAYSEVTICFKKNHTDISTLESVKLSGGKCLDSNSQSDMLKKGWKLDNFNIRNGGYLFVFKKNDNNLPLANTQVIEDIVDKKIGKIEKKKSDDIAKTIKIKKDKSFSLGKRTYVKKCSSCHGLNADKKAGNSAILSSMTLDDFLDSLKGYKVGSYSLGNSAEMKPYAVGFSSYEMKNVFEYIKSLK
jgi:cytochrome c553